MKNYSIGLVTGILLTASALMYMGANSKNMGHITADSITLFSEFGAIKIIGGSHRTSNKHGVQVGYFGTNKDLDGIITLSDRSGDIGWGASGKK